VDKAYQADRTQGRSSNTPHEIYTKNCYKHAWLSDFSSRFLCQKNKLFDKKTPKFFEIFLNRRVRFGLSLQRQEVVIVSGNVSC